MPEWLIIVLVVAAGGLLLILSSAEHLSQYARSTNRGRGCSQRGRAPAEPTNPQLSDRYDPAYLQQQEAMQASQPKE